MKDVYQDIGGEILKCNPLHETRFLNLNGIEYQLNHDGLRRQYYSASRPRREHQTVDGVVVIATREFEGHPQILLVKQFRPPVAKIVTELPAGLLDANESPGEAGLRELLEETGYRGQVVDVSPPLYTSPGMSNECCVFVRVEVDTAVPPTPQPEEDEKIHAFWLNASELPAYLKSLDPRETAVNYLWNLNLDHTP